MAVNICAQTVLYDLVKDKVEWHEEPPKDWRLKLIESSYSYHVAYYDKGVWNTGDCGIKISGIKRWAEVPREYWQRYIDGEFGTYEAWSEYVDRLNARKEKESKMTKEKLKQEAEEYALNQWEGNLPWSVIQKAYYDGALPREKQIQIDAEQIRALQKDKGELTDRVKELEVQFEKMKSPLNCKHSSEKGFCMKGNGYCICDKWELEEK